MYAIAEDPEAANGRRCLALPRRCDRAGCEGQRAVDRADRRMGTGCSVTALRRGLCPNGTQGEPVAFESACQLFRQHVP